jgi:hypothetical protein
MKLLGAAAQGVVELLDEVPANLILAYGATIGGLCGLLGLALLEINITVRRHGCRCDAICYEGCPENRENSRCSTCAAGMSKMNNSKGKVANQLYER